MSQLLWAALVFAITAICFWALGPIALEPFGVGYTVLVYVGGSLLARFTREQIETAQYFTEGERRELLRKFKQKGQGDA